MSPAKIKPFLPPLIVATMFEQGSVISASPEANATNLIGVGIRIILEKKASTLWNGLLTDKRAPCEVQRHSVEEVWQHWHL